MAGLFASHDLIRVVANTEAVPAGYLYTFLASRYGRVSIRRQTYGGSVKHIEPEQLRELLIPRVDRGVEQRYFTRRSPAWIDRRGQRQWPDRGQNRPDVRNEPQKTREHGPERR